MGFLQTIKATVMVTVMVTVMATVMAMETKVMIINMENTEA